MTYLVERLAELDRDLAHLRELRPRVSDAAALRGNLEDYTEAVRALDAYPDFPPELIESLALLPGFRNVLLHEYVKLDLERAVLALDGLGPVEEFTRRVVGLLKQEESS